MTSFSSPPDQANEDNQAQLVEKLFNEIRAHAKNGDFAQAEELREKMIELAPMSLKEIIGSAELIEQEKSIRLDPAHLEIWNKLYQTLTEEERNCLFYSLKKIILPAKKIILLHQKFNNRLFFIDKGQITVYRQKENKNVILTQLGPGELLGEYTFCTISLCSASAASLTETHLYYLERSATQSWEINHPALMNKLISFCKQEGHIDEIIKLKTQEEATYPRHSINGRVTANLLAKDGQKSATTFRGNLEDISRSGTCFQFKCSKETTARALLNRDLLISFSIEKEEIPLTFSATGKIIQVSFHLYNDYSLHIQFNSLLPHEIIEKLK